MAKEVSIYASEKYEVNSRAYRYLYSKKEDFGVLNGLIDELDIQCIFNKATKEFPIKHYIIPNYEYLRLIKGTIKIEMLNVDYEINVVLMRDSEEKEIVESWKTRKDGHGS